MREQTANGQTHLDYIDFLNIFACFCVICLHCSGAVFHFEESRLWFISMFVQTVFHFAVPVFFMVSGANLLEYRARYDTKTFFKKRLMRTGVPFLFWSVFYLFLPCILNGASLPTAVMLRNAVFNNEANYIFWFFYAIFGIYLSMPILSLLAKKENFKVISYLCLLSYFFNGLLPCITKFGFPITGWIVPPIVSGYIGYVFLGWLIRYETFSKRTRICVYISGALGAVLMFFGTWLLSKKGEGTDILFMEYNSVACFPLSAAVMLGAKHFPWRVVYRVIPQKIVSKISSTTLGIYVMHMLCLSVTERFGVLTAHPIYAMVIFPPIIFLLCMAVALLLSKIPIVKRIVP